LTPIIALAALFLGTGGCHRNIPVAAEVPIDSNRNCPQVLRFTANPRVIQPGGEVLLSWNIRNVDEITLEESREDVGAANRGDYLRIIGKFPSTGTLRVSPKVTTTYVISCGDDLVGCASASVSVIVK